MLLTKQLRPFPRSGFLEFRIPLCYDEAVPNRRLLSWQNLGKSAAVE